VHIGLKYVITSAFPLQLDAIQEAQCKKSFSQGFAKWTERVLELHSSNAIKLGYFEADHSST
jgi:hypothetical protein